MRTIHRPLRDRVRLRLVHQVGHPGRDRLDQHLRAFALQEVEHVEVAVAFGDLRPEFAGDLHQRLHLVRSTSMESIFARAFASAFR